MFGASVPPAWASLTIAQIAPVLPYLLLVAMLSVRPRGLFGEGGDDA
jgi:branched-chain amino acid transport system permease protein